MTYLIGTLSSVVGFAGEAGVDARDRRGAFLLGPWRDGGTIHLRALRRVRDQQESEHAVELRVPHLRLACVSCGPRMERLD